MWLAKWSWPRAGGHAWPEKGLAARQMDRTGWVGQAEAGLDEDLCGYTAHIRSEAPADAPKNVFPSEGDSSKDKIYTVHNGKVLVYGDNYICVGNTPPDARVVNGHLEMIEHCDRAYPGSYFTEHDPDLSQEATSPYLQPNWINVGPGTLSPDPLHSIITIPLKRPLGAAF